MIVDIKVVMKDTPNHENMNDIPPYLTYPILRRSYKAYCSMDSCCNLTNVYNNKRVGGLCHTCSAYIKAIYIISRWRQRQRQLMS